MNIIAFFRRKPKPFFDGPPLVQNFDTMNALDDMADAFRRPNRSPDFYYDEGMFDNLCDWPFDDC